MKSSIIFVHTKENDIASSDTGVHDMRRKASTMLRTARGIRDHELPLYQIIFQSIRDEILSERYDAVGALPSELSLEERFKVSRITIRRACDELERAALIERSKGRSARILPRLSPV